ncbi:Wall-associated protein precursor [Archangium lansingense]|uniref:Wall-associated protein n=1 Tax=Archangium lansingense TaxID=2995310 RepID=A0ABT4AJ02_9BACT|nr:Wall-associated protein precursor [Archangium lansinium]MCY1081169.1 Wall-associated protein precursor [Archangium lansinium]
MFASLLMLLLTQQPATPGETLVECLCEKEALQEQAVLEVMEWFEPRAKREEEAGQKADSAAEAEVAPDCSEPKECKGQLHHVISKPIAKALTRHRTLRGQYKARDPRFVTRAVDEQAHCGYQEWHRKVDAEVVEWLKEHRDATSKQFEAFLRTIYDRPDMRVRFPHGF